jgi:hypothetical protein
VLADISIDHSIFKLKELKEQLDRRVITQGEYKQKKKKIGISKFSISSSLIVSDRFSNSSYLMKKNVLINSLFKRRSLEKCGRVIRFCVLLRRTIAFGSVLRV